MKWAEFVRKHGPQVYQIAWRILGHVHDCEDVVQEVFINAHQLFVANEVKHWPTLLHRLTTFRAIDSLRKRRAIEMIEIDQLLDQTETPEQVLMATELENRIRALVASLPERQAAVFCLIYFEDKSNTQAASILEISENAVSLALYKARNALRATLVTPPKEHKS